MTPEAAIFQIIHEHNIAMLHIMDRVLPVVLLPIALGFFYSFSPQRHSLRRLGTAVGMTCSASVINFTLWFFLTRNPEPEEHKLAHTLLAVITHQSPDMHYKVESTIPGQVTVSTWNT